MVLRLGGALAPTTSIILFDGYHQPPLDQCQQVPVADPPGHALHQLGVGDAVEVTLQIGIDHPVVTGLEGGIDLP